jgi:hypothetical protein
LLSDGSLHSAVATDADGVWPSGANTVNPTGGLTPVRIQAYEAPMPVELLSFFASVHENSVLLSWETATELNNLGFDIERRIGNESWIKLGFVGGNGTSTSVHEYSFVDNNIASEKYSYRLKQIDNDGSLSYSNEVEVDVTLPGEFNLQQNYPNPFNPSTTISWQSPVSSWQTLKVYDMLGNKVATLVNEYRPAGKYEVKFDASRLSSGIYFYELQVGDFISVKKLLLMK